jgi:hypothetical protein
MAKPTETAQIYFQSAHDQFARAAVKQKLDTFEYQIASGLSNMAVGLNNLSVGLRATYILLEQLTQQRR